MTNDEADGGQPGLCPVLDLPLGVSRPGLAEEMLAEGADLRAAFAADPIWPAMRARPRDATER